MNDVYENIDLYNPNRQRKVLALEIEDNVNLTLIIG